MQETKRVDLSSYRDLDVASVRIRRMKGSDVIRAATLCIDPGTGKPMEGAQFGLNFRQQQVTSAIIEVNDKKVVGATCTDYFDWGARTHEFIGKAFDYLNGMSRDEDDDFMARLKEPDVAAPQASSSTTA